MQLDVQYHLDGLTVQLHSGPSATRYLWTTWTADLGHRVFAAVAVAAILGVAVEASHWPWLTAAVVVAAVVVWGPRMARRPRGSTLVTVSRGQLTVDGDAHPAVRYRRVEPSEVVALADLVDCYEGSGVGDGGEYRLLVLRFKGNRYVEIPATAHTEDQLTALAVELKRLGRAAESRAGAVPDEVHRLRDAT